MNTPRTVMVDGNEAAAMVAYRLSEVIAIYPITPSSPMGELSDEWSASGRPNIWGAVPQVVEMQSEGGAAGAVHGAIQAGALATTFTASQGLLLMIPNMYKIAGELTPFCMHVAARSLATHALSIFGDHSDVMACRQTGFALLASSTVQEAHDMALIAHAASLESRVPFLHFFDGFRTSHQISKIAVLSDEDLRAIIDGDAFIGHRQRALTPDHPVLRGTAQNPDVFFQAREACNGYYIACADIVQRIMDRFAQRTGRQYRLFDYSGSPQAKRVIVLMGSGAETARDTARALSTAGDAVGVLTVRLFRPFSIEALCAALPPTVERVAVLDRTKEPGSVGEPLFLDVGSALRRELGGTAANRPDIRFFSRGRYGLSSKEFTPAMVKAVFDELEQPAPRNEFTVGITDDVTHLSLDADDDLDIEPPSTRRAVFYGLGADGTVGANKSTIKIIGTHTDLDAQGYFVYDSKKSGAMTVSHLRCGSQPIHAPYLITRADFVACHQFSFVDRIDMLSCAAPGATVLINAPFGPDTVWDNLPREIQTDLIEKELRLHVIDADAVAREHGMGGRINTIMQTCFFALTDMLPTDQAIAAIKADVAKKYSRKGAEVVRRNNTVVDAALEHLHRVVIPDRVSASRARHDGLDENAPDFVKRITAVMLAGRGDQLPVSAFPVDGTWPLGTARWEKRSIASHVPAWDPAICIQCNKCAMVCPHAAIRTKVYDPAKLDGAPGTFQSMDYKAKDFRNMALTIQVAPEDCTGCKLCVHVCPAKDKANPRHKALDMVPLDTVVDNERDNFAFFLDLPELPRERLTRLDVKGVQLLQPLFEFSGACSGCGETPYVKLLTQLFGDRALIANATGCSSIYGGNLPTTPYCCDADGRGPAWSNSLFEDNAEFGCGFRLAQEAQYAQAAVLLERLAGLVGGDLASALLDSALTTPDGIAAQRQRVVALKQKLTALDDLDAAALLAVADALVPRSVWIVGGDGWAYDIGYGGLDHVLSMPWNVNVLVLDTEVYSNTGGQASKATPLGAAAKFAIRGKEVAKKDLGLMAMHYGHVYVASVAFGARDNHTVQTFLEAEAHPGPSMIIAYSHCIAHGYDLQYGLDQQKRAVDSGIWPLYRYDPHRVDAGEPPLVLDAPAGRIPVSEYMRHETRFRMVETMDPVRFKKLAAQAQRSTQQRIAVYQHLAQLRLPQEHNGRPASQQADEEAVACSTSGGAT